MPAATTTTLPPRVSLEHGVGEGEYDLDLDPGKFEYNTGTSTSTDDNGTHSPDSPTLGSAEEGHYRRASRFVDEMATPGAETATASNPLASSSSSSGAQQQPAQNLDHVVDPATIPIRTSSSNAVGNGGGGGGAGSGGAGDRYSTSPKSPKQHRSSQALGSVPEERRLSHHMRAQPEERDWLAQGQHHQQQQQRQSQSQSQPPHQPRHSRSNSNNLRSLENRASTSFTPTSTPMPQAQPSSSISTSNHHSRPSTSSTPRDSLDNSPSTWTSEKENILRGPFDYLESHPGKDIRTQLITAFNAWLRVPAPSLAIITRVVGMLHTASLLIDDVEDSSSLRRGVPVAHQIFGAAQTINSANYVYFCALQELLSLENPTVVRIYTEELVNLHRGQGMDLFWRDTLTCPSEDDYLEMVGNKTGGLFRLAIKLMCAESPSHNSSFSSQTDYTPLANTIGLLFQILDDYQNLSSPTYTTNKGICEDLTEGKFSFPIIHAIRADPSNLVLINILKQKTRDEDVKRFAVGYMERVGSFTYTRRVLRGLTKKALTLVEAVERSVGVVGGGDGEGEGVRGILERLRVERPTTVAGAEGGGAV